jgi:hypothetical protein
VTYIADPARWDKLAEKLQNPATWPLGVDSETFGQPDKTSPQWRARVQCWSLGVYTAGRSPRGYRIAQGVVLPRESLDHPGLRSLLERADVPKLAHNAPHDYHSLTNEGLTIRGMEDTLQWARIALPGLWCGYGLKDLEVHVLGKAPRPDFKEVTRLDFLRTLVKRKKERACVCGDVPCRAKQTSDWWDPVTNGGMFREHTRVSWLRFTPESKPAVRQRDVTEMVPGCPGWDTWVAYALADAVGVLELADYLTNRPAKWSAKEWPWTTATSAAIRATAA